MESGLIAFFVIGDALIILSITVPFLVRQIRSGDEEKREGGCNGYGRIKMTPETEVDINSVSPGWTV